MVASSIRVLGGLVSIVLAIAMLVIVADLLFSESLDSDIIVWQSELEGSNNSLKIRYFVPYTGGGTSKCYPQPFMKFTPSEKVIIKRSKFFDICLVLRRNRGEIKKENGDWLNRHRLSED